MYFVRLMARINVKPNIMAMFYNSTISSVLAYSNIAFYDLLPKYVKYDMDGPRRSCEKLLKGRNDINLCENDKLFADKAVKVAKKIMKDDKHPLHEEFTLLPSARRLRVPYSRTNRHKGSFVPRAINLLNYV